jgi:LuxR family transcriptional regulator of spore coat protein
MSWVENSVEPSLSPREQQILELVANGYSAKEAASHLGIAPRTVERHIENIRLKMRARNRAHMVTQAILAGCLEIGRRQADDLFCSNYLLKEEGGNAIPAPLAARTTEVS